MKTAYVPIVGKVQAVVAENDSISTIKIALEEELAFSPGQFVEVGVFGVGEAPLSVVGGSGKCLEISVKKIGNVTNKLHGLKKGEVVFVRGPFGNGYPLEELEGKKVVFVSGGVGIANLAASVDYCLERKDKYEKLSLVYGINTENERIFREKVNRWEKDLDSCVVTVWKPETTWKGKTGLVTEYLTENIVGNNTVVLVCGPQAMIGPVASKLNELGIKNDSIYVSLERSMKCGVGKCGHCTIGNVYVCRDGPIFRYDKYLEIKEAQQ